MVEDVQSATAVPNAQVSRRHERNTMSIGDKASNKAQELAGKGKEAAGDLTDNRDLKAEGQADQTEGKAKQAGEKLKDAAGDAKEAITGH